MLLISIFPGWYRKWYRISLTFMVLYQSYCDKTIFQKQKIIFNQRLDPLMHQHTLRQWWDTCARFLFISWVRAKIQDKIAKIGLGN